MDEAERAAQTREVFARKMQSVRSDCGHPMPLPLSSGESFVTARTGAWRWLIHPSLETPALRSYLEHPGLFLNPPAESLKQNPANTSSEVVKAMLPNLPPLVVKRYRPKNLWKLFLGFFRPAPGLSVFRRAAQLRQFGIATPRPLGVGVKQFGPSSIESYYLSEEISCARSLRDYYGQPHAGPAIKRAIRALAIMIAELHNCSLSHTDLHLGNFLVRGSESYPELFLIDLEALRARRRMALADVARDLRRFWRRPRVEERERLYCLAAYCRARRPRVSARQLLRLIVKER